MSEESQNQSNEPFSEGADDDPLLYDDQPQSAINRPASGARQALPGEILSMDFRGSETAGDFLGLDTEFTEAIADGGAGEPLDLAQAPLSGEADEEASDSPLTVMDPDLQDEDDFASEYPDSEFGGEDELGTAEYDDYNQEAGEFDPEAEFYDDAFEGDEVLETSSGRGKLLIGGIVAVGLLTAAAVTLVPRFLSDSPDGGVEIATNTTPPVDTDPDPTDVGTDPTPIDVDPIAVDPTLDPTDTGTDPDTVEVPDIENFLTPDTTGTETDPFDLTNLLGGNDPGQTGDPVNDVTNQISQIFGLQPQGAQGDFPDFGAGFEWVSEDMLDMIWRGSEVPMEAIAAPARTLMPRVGNVMVHMSTGEVFEGRLYAVGENRVWIDAQPGRIGLDGDSVERIERLAVPEGFLPVGTQPAASGKRVRVQLPGGPIYGRVLAENGNMVTLVTDDGAKVTLKDPEIESMGNRRAIIIHR